jgi:hypothetical protein
VLLGVNRISMDDTIRVIVPSVRPTRRRAVVPTIDPSSQQQRDDYIKRLCNALNGWAKNGPLTVQGRAVVSAKLGIGVAILKKSRFSPDGT